MDRSGPIVIFHVTAVTEVALAEHNKMLISRISLRISGRMAESQVLFSRKLPQEECCSMRVHLDKGPFEKGMKGISPDGGL
jgi:hypothetical protein